MRPYQPRIALIVDNPLRDLAGQVLLGLELSRRGFNVFLVPLSTPRELWAIAPDAIVFTYARTTNANLIQQAYQHGIKCIILETEGGIFLGGIETRYLAMNINPSIRNNISLICAWGEKYKDFVVEKGIYSEDKVIITGHPRFDFYHSSLKRTIEKIDSHISIPAEDEKKRIILVATTFARVNPRYTNYEQEQSRLKQFSYTQEYIDTLMAIQTNALESFLKLIKQLAEHFPNAIIIVRPHPFESLEVYQRAFPNHPDSNIVIRQEGSITSWLNRAVALIHWSSSTAVEASLMGVPSFIPNWIPTMQEDTLSLVSIKCETIDDLFNQLSSTTDSLDTVSQVFQHSLIYDVFYKIDGQAHQRVADQVEILVGHVEESIASHSLSDLAYDSGGTSFYAKWMDRARSLFKLPVNLTRYVLYNKRQTNSNKVDKFFSKEDVNRIANAIMDEISTFRDSIVLDYTRYYYPLLNGKSVQIVKETK